MVLIKIRYFYLNTEKIEKYNRSYELKDKYFKYSK